MTIELNGERVEVPAGARLVDVVAEAGVEAPRGVAVALDGEVVPRAAWAETPVRDGQRVEIVAAVQGG